MISISLLGLVVGSVLSTVNAACTPNTTSVADLQGLLQDGGQGYTLSLCAGQIYPIDKILNYTAVEQEISTEGYPTDEARATLLISGFNMTTAVQATDANLDRVKLRNIQIDGNRGSSDIYEHPGANIEFGGENTGQLIEYVRSYDPRGWSCMHISEGPFRCSGVTIQNNDLGPCGSEKFQQWADGISLSCQNSLVQNNYIVDATDGGIVIFGSPNSTIRNNTIHVETRTLLGGINMVDPVPWEPEGNFSHVVVEENRIIGGYATGLGNDTLGTNNASAIIKIGIGIGPRVWFSDNRYGTNQTTGAIVQNNLFSGAFAFAIGLASAKNFLLQNNTFFGNVSFIGSYGPNCTDGALTPHPPIALLYEQSTLTNVTIQPGTVPDDIAKEHPDTTAFQNGVANGLTCFMPPSANTFAWPYGGGGVNSGTGASGTSGEKPSGTSGGGSSSSSSSPATSHGAAADRSRISTGAALGGLVLLAAMGFGMATV